VSDFDRYRDRSIVGDEVVITARNGGVSSEEKMFVEARIRENNYFLLETP